MQVTTNQQSFGVYKGKIVNKYTITQQQGIQFSVINYGATITSIIVPDKTGAPVDVVLGFDTLDAYINATDMYPGCICGRYANRIANGIFHINGNTYQLTKNNGANALHGGEKGFNKQFWEGEILPTGDGVKFTYISSDKEEGYPGNLIVTVTYRVQNNSLCIEYAAETDKATPVNLTSHCYFNLSGKSGADILDHELQLLADKILETDESLIPTGRFISTAGTSFDFLCGKKIGEALQQESFYDYTWVVNDNGNSAIKKAAALKHPGNGIEMIVYTSQPGIHFYTGHHLSAGLPIGKTGNRFNKFGGLCLEAQHFPDSPNHKEFPNTILHPGDKYLHQTIYSFTNGVSLT